MPKVTLPIANGFYQSDSLPISAQECLNLYPNIVQAPALSQETLFGAPGLVQKATTGTVKQANRGAHLMAGKAYFVNGESLYRLNSDYTLDNLGTIPGTARVSMADNGTQLCILIPGGNGYIFTESPDTLTQITDADFTANGNPQYVVFIDGYFLFTTDTKKFIVSALNNGLAYDALDFGSAESDPDDIVAPIVYKNQVFIGGSQTIEAFQNIGGADFPFQRTGLFLAKGIKAPFSIEVANDTFMFVGGDVNESPAIWAFAGNTVQKVSTTAIDSLLQKLTDAEQAAIFSYSYAQKGAYFTCFTLPETTLCYDSISQRWHERKSNIEGDLQRYRVNSLITAYGAVLVGDRFDGRVGELDPTDYQEYGVDITRRVATQPFQNNMDSFFVPQIELTCEAGVGNAAVPDPKLRLDISRDGGKTFKESRTRPMGKIGEYMRRTIWRRNGRMSRFSVFRFTLTDAVKPVFIQLTADIVPGGR